VDYLSGKHQDYHWSSKFKLIFNALFPRECVLCGDSFIFTNQNIVCDDCLSKFEKTESFFCRSCGKSGENTHPICEECKYDRKYSYIEAFTDYYESGEILREYKFGKYKNLAYDIAKIIKEDFQKFVRQNQVQNILYIPISNKKLKERGFNHLKEILTYIFPKYLVKDYLIKVKETKLQVELNKTERFENLKDNFELTVDKIDGNTLIFDDILTTGATLLEAYKTIKNKVNGNLYAYVIAKV